MTTPDANTDTRTAHTPGPWRYHVYDDGSSAIIPDVGYQVCTMAEVPPKRIQANARLIAEAPAMLEALAVLAGFAKVTHRHTATGDECLTCTAITDARAIIDRIES